MGILKAVHAVRVISTLILACGDVKCRQDFLEGKPPKGFGGVQRYCERVRSLAVDQDLEAERDCAVKAAGGLVGKGAVRIEREFAGGRCAAWRQADGQVFI